MDQINIANKDHIPIINKFFVEYLKNKSTDCILYSNDGSEIKIQREILGKDSSRYGQNTHTDFC